MTRNEQRLVTALKRSTELLRDALPAVLEKAQTEPDYAVLHAHMDEQQARNVRLISEIE